MSITKETLEQHLKDPAIFCCRREKGLVISAADLEDPSLFDDMVDAGLLTLSPNGLKIEQVLGSTLLTDVEALTPITAEVLDKVNETDSSAEKESVTNESKPIITTKIGGEGMLHIEIAKADHIEGLKLDLPIGGAAAPVAETFVPALV